jgi:hypothetical protein
LELCRASDRHNGSLRTALSTCIPPHPEVSEEEEYRIAAIKSRVSPHVYYPEITALFYRHACACGQIGQIWATRNVLYNASFGVRQLESGFVVSDVRRRLRVYRCACRVVFAFRNIVLGPSSPIVFAFRLCSLSYVSLEVLLDCWKTRNDRHTGHVRQRRSCLDPSGTDPFNPCSGLTRRSFKDHCLRVVPQKPKCLLRRSICSQTSISGQSHHGNSNTTRGGPYFRGSIHQGSQSMKNPTKTDYSPPQIFNNGTRRPTLFYGIAIMPPFPHNRRPTPPYHSSSAHFLALAHTLQTHRPSPVALDGRPASP